MKCIKKYQNKAFQDKTNHYKPKTGIDNWWLHAVVLSQKVDKYDYLIMNI